MVSKISVCVFVKDHLGDKKLLRHSICTSKEICIANHMFISISVIGKND